METKSNKLIPVRAIHPGEILREELQERGIKQKEFALTINVQPTHLNEFINGKRNINETIAMKFEESLGIPFKTWMNLQNNYAYDIKAIQNRKEEAQKAIEYETECSSIFNLHLLYKRLGLSLLSCSKRVKKINELFPFDLRSSGDLSHNLSGLYKHSNKVQIDDKNMLTWLILNQKEILKIETLNTYKKGNAILAATHIAKMANKNIININSIKQCLKEYGISYIEVGKIEKAPIDAYSTIVNNNPIITVTYRYNDMDKLAFDILHELCHIERHLSEDSNAFISIDGIDYSSDPREKEANEFAKQMLIPNATWNKIINTKCNSLSPSQIVKAIAAEAKHQGISQSIAVSRYKHDTHWYKTSSFKSPKIH